ncbi:MAG TPA: hypothetical protein VD993_12980 [Chitinophagaceae bacterium]|nr:hypothetical protein [Chitinophagaceae bacterium]
MPACNQSWHNNYCTVDMEWKSILLAGLLAACTGCGDNKDPESNTGKSSDTAVVDDSLISTTPIPLDGCYKMIINKDTATLRLNVIDSLVTGELRYHWFEKDWNDGSVKGVVRDSLIILDYTFRSEGVLSVREVVFKMAGTSLVEGTGDLRTGDTVRFKDIQQLKFQYDYPFIKTPCVE